MIIDYIPFFFGELDKTFKGHEYSGYSMVVLPDGRLCSGGVDRTIKIWDTKTGECIKTLIGHNGSIYSLTVLPDGRLCSGSSDRTIKIWK